MSDLTEIPHCKKKWFLPFFLAWSTSPTCQLFTSWFFLLTFWWFIDPNWTFSANSEIAINAFKTTIEQKGKSFTTTCTDSLAERFLLGQQRFELPVILSRSQVRFNLPEMQKYVTIIQIWLVKVWLHILKNEKIVIYAKNKFICYNSNNAVGPI